MYSPTYGGIPTVPGPTATAQSALAGNIGNLGSIYGLAGGLNQFQQQQAGLGLRTNLPGYESMITKSSGNISDLLAGQIPADVISQINQGAAERGVATGAQPGSPNFMAALLRSLGLTSLGLQQQGESELTAAIGRTPTAPLIDPTAFLVSPDQEQQAAAAQSLYASAPVPSLAAAANQAAAKQGLAQGLSAVRAPGISMPTITSPGGGGGATSATIGPLGALGPFDTNRPDQFTTQDWLASIGLGPGGTTTGAAAANQGFEASEYGKPMGDAGMNYQPTSLAEAANMLGMDPAELDAETAQFYFPDASFGDQGTPEYSSPDYSYYEGA
jgi:hypothetical protein